MLDTTKVDSVNLDKCFEALKALNLPQKLYVEARNKAIFCIDEHEFTCRVSFFVGREHSNLRWHPYGEAQQLMDADDEHSWVEDQQHDIMSVSSEGAYKRYCLQRLYSRPQESCHYFTMPFGMCHRRAPVLVHHNGTSESLFPQCSCRCGDYKSASEE